MHGCCHVEGEGLDGRLEMFGAFLSFLSLPVVLCVRPVLARCSLVRSAVAPLLHWWARGMTALPEPGWRGGAGGTVPVTRQAQRPGLFGGAVGKRRAGVLLAARPRALCFLGDKADQLIGLPPPLPCPTLPAATADSGTVGQWDSGLCHGPLCLRRGVTSIAQPKHGTQHSTALARTGQPGQGSTLPLRLRRTDNPQPSITKHRPPAHTPPVAG